MKHIHSKIFTLAILEVENIIRLIWKKKRSEPKEIIIPVLASTGIPHNVMIKIFGTYALFGFLIFLIVKDIITSSSATSEPGCVINNTSSNQYPHIGFPVNEYNKKRVLPLYLHCPFQIGQYVIFRQKNKNNSSLIHVNLGEIGLIVEKLNGLDHALVDFSIDIPIRFKKLDTINLVKNAYNEGVLIIEILKEK